MLKSENNNKLFHFFDKIIGLILIKLSNNNK